MTAFGFDFDHTLGVDNGLERNALFIYASELGHPLDANDPVWRKQLEDVLAVFRAGDISMTDMLIRFGKLVAAHDVCTERWREICYDLVPQLVRPIEGARELVTALRTNDIPTAILTNGWTPLQQKKIAYALGADALAMPILVSDALHAVKPSREAFDALVATLNVPREQVWYVGDNPRGDVAGALAAGLRAAWFNWENQTYPQDLPPPTLTIASLRELETMAENTTFP
ncbi:MAG: pyrimidine 5-nucleotidase [Candidatus Eremiobacteraeota bacterium]|nr:pyrimidine 5-nucleotidase [Candidatus Eremiobacteraeota bacterium]